MRYLVAPDSFKGTLTSYEAAECIRRALLRADPFSDVTVLTVADGGEGTVEAFYHALWGKIETVTVEDLSGNAAAAPLLITERATVIEAASCVGHPLIQETPRNPRKYWSTGFGPLLVAAREKRQPLLLAGLGGSGTVDAGLGMAKALGYHFEFDATTFDSSDVLESLEHVHAVIPPSENVLANIEIIALADVTNPLTGARGAVYTYGPQKGIAPELLQRWDDAVIRFANVIRRDVGLIDLSLPGMGAAGGLGFAMAAFCGARIARGASFILDAIGFDKTCADADVLITGEGKIDTQTGYGKIVGEIAERAKQKGTPVVAFAGVVDGDAEAIRAQLGLADVIVCEGDSSEQLTTEVAARRLEAAVERWATERR